MGEIAPVNDRRFGKEASYTGRCAMLQQLKPSGKDEAAEVKRRSIFTEAQWRSIGRDLHLSGRELQIVQCVFKGESEAAIGQELGMSVHTVHTHVRRLYGKLGVSDRCQLLLEICAAYISPESGHRDRAACLPDQV